MKIITQKQSFKTLGTLSFLLVFITIFLQHYMNLFVVPYAIYNVISIIIFLICKPIVSTQYLIMLVPFANALHIKKIAVYYFLIFLFKFLFKNKAFKVNIYTMISFLTVIILQLIAGTRCNDAISTLVYLVAVMGCVVLWSKNFYQEDTCYYFLKSYLISFSMMAMFLIALTVKLVPIRQLLNGYVRLGEDSYFEDAAFHTGANGLGMMCLFCSSILCYLLLRKQVKKVVFIPMLLLFAITGFLTQSRAFIFGCVFLVAYLVFFYSKSFGQTIKLMLAFGVVAICVLFFISNFYPGILEHFVERFEVDDITNGREDLMTGYFHSLFQDPISLLFGAGLLSYVDVLGANVGYVSSHNATQEVMLAWGVFGLIAIVVWFVSLAQSRGIKYHDGNRMQALLPLFMLLFMVQSTRIFSTFTSIFLIGVALFCIIPKKRECK